MPWLSIPLIVPWVAQHPKTCFFLLEEDMSWNRGGVVHSLILPSNPVRMWPGAFWTWKLGRAPGPYGLEVTTDASEQVFPAVSSFVDLHSIIHSYVLEDHLICFLFSLPVHMLQTTVGSVFIVLSLAAPHNGLQAKADARSEQKAHSRLKCLCPQRLPLMSTPSAPTSPPFSLLHEKMPGLKEKKKKE